MITYEIYKIQLKKKKRSKFLYELRQKTLTLCDHVTLQLCDHLHKNREVLTTEKLSPGKVKAVLDPVLLYYNSCRSCLLSLSGKDQYTTTWIRQCEYFLKLQSDTFIFFVFQSELHKELQRFIAYLLNE